MPKRSTGWLVDLGCKKARTYFFFEDKRKIRKNWVVRSGLEFMTLRFDIWRFANWATRRVAWLLWQNQIYHNSVSHFFMKHSRFEYFGLAFQPISAVILCRAKRPELNPTNSPFRNTFVQGYLWPQQSPLVSLFFGSEYVILLYDRPSINGEYVVGDFWMAGLAIDRWSSQP